MRNIRLPRLGTFDVWRDTARELAAYRMSPDQVSWSMETEAPSLFNETETPLFGPRQDVNVPKDFPKLAKLLCASRASGALDLAYRLLLRVCDAPSLLGNRADPDVARALTLTKNIRRDMHKMKAFVRFREVSQTAANRRQFISWFEPDHRIEELIAGFFARRFGDMDWVIVTPEVTTRFEAGKIIHEAIPTARLDLSDETEELWRTYYANIFNPARLKIKAMQSEMPKKYWKNLPEAALIPDLIAQAEAQVEQMQARAPTLPPLRAERVLDRLHEPTVETQPDLALAIRACDRCPLAGPATQAVLGEGPADAPLMVVGEQPGDREDLTGRPFVGPAGQMFDKLALEAELDRTKLYITNAVKHFKFQVRAKRRIHQSPSRNEVSQCRWWLEQEIAQIQPQLILAMGATAALALTGNGNDLTKRRGSIEQGLAGVPVFITLHPAALLRHPDENARIKMMQLLRDDLTQAANHAGMKEG